MLKTNSKKARENIKNYILENFTAENYTDTPPTDWHGIANFIYDCFVQQSWTTENEKKYFSYNEKRAFEYWCSGLPSVLDTCYYYNRSAVEDLGEILEQTEAERNKYSEEQASELLTALIFRELKSEYLPIPKIIY